MAALVEERKFSAGQAELERYQAELERSRLELQRSQIELQRQRKQLELDKEIAVARAELQVFEEYENASVDENTVRLPSESISHRIATRRPAHLWVIQLHRSRARRQ